MKHSLESNAKTNHLGILEVAERLFRQMGFEKTTVSDIAHELRMSPANVYRFFPSKAAINEAVARRLLIDVEGAVEEVAKRGRSASERLRASIAAIEKSNAQRFLDNSKLHELVETAFNENWAIAREHIDRVTRLLCEIITQGNRGGEFAASDPELAAILIRSASIRFWHPRLMVECAQDPEPTLDQMVDFCLSALTQDLSEAKLDVLKRIRPMKPPQSIAAAS